ncbi:diguanylate cyclase [Arhodomonas aquaeolei]|uniref:bifunctional diguanylate cyclase/phosphodiesterase n=1 Tax=Arhodomonas aquaeolei TaxID=2369 RepID=UPI00216989C4|nr:sensor domain-containing diguanylate cyclase [Arhodomonas aquaeolei]MCS4504920.1 diguanylate cyclase [Arhodomonas aquaeolei]
MSQEARIAVIDLTHCDREPIHVPEQIQPFGLMLVSDGRSGRITRVSANTDTWLDTPPETCLNRPLAELTGKPLAETIREAARGLDTGHRVTSGTLTAGRTGERAVSVTVHRVGDEVVAEMEPDSPIELSRSLLQHQVSAISRTSKAAGSDELLTLAVEEIAAATGYMRVLAYRFDDAWNGDVVAETTNGVPPRFEGHHFPHTDIPAQARALYRRNRIRVIPDIEYTPTALVTGTDQPLDMSDCLLRSVSPVHLEYLRNMGVTATLVMSLLVEGELWGMIVCQSDTPKTMPQPLRQFCDTLARMLGLQIESHLRREIDAETVAAAEEIDALRALLQAGTDLPSALRSRSERLLGAFHSRSLILHIADNRTVLGEQIAAATERRIVDHAATPEADRIACADHLAPEIRPEGTEDSWIAGYMYLPISRDGEDYCLWLRGENPFSIPWAGNPEKTGTDEGHDPASRLTPRRSFELWLEEVRGTSEAWRIPQRRAAYRFRELLRMQLASEYRAARIRERTLRRMATHDDLTELPNRTLVMDRLRKATDEAQRDGTAVLCLFIDLDGFKPVNDAYGHGVGDEVLKILAERLAETLRGSDSVGRVGGDEFVVVARVNTHRRWRHAGEVLAERVIDLAARPVTVDEVTHAVGCSIGIAVFPEIDASPEALMQQADQAMYAAKGSGGNTYRFADGSA